MTMIGVPVRSNDAHKQRGFSDDTQVQVGMVRYRYSYRTVDDKRQQRRLYRDIASILTLLNLGQPVKCLALYKGRDSKTVFRLIINTPFQTRDIFPGVPKCGTDHSDTGTHKPV